MDERKFPAHARVFLRSGGGAGFTRRPLAPDDGSGLLFCLDSSELTAKQPNNFGVGRREIGVHRLLATAGIVI